MHKSTYWQTTLTFSHLLVVLLETEKSVHLHEGAAPQAVPLRQVRRVRVVHINLRMLLQILLVGLLIWQVKPRSNPKAPDKTCNHKYQASYDAKKNCTNFAKQAMQLMSGQNVSLQRVDGMAVFVHSAFL